MNCEIDNCSKEPKIKFGSTYFCGKRHALVWFDNQIEHLPSKALKTYSKSTDNYLLKQLKMSRAVKVKSGYSRNIGAGFIAEDIEQIKPVSNRKIHVKTYGLNGQNLNLPEINLRETEELIKFLELKIAEDKLKKTKERYEK
jgi:hypothetical protein